MYRPGQILTVTIALTVLMFAAEGFSGNDDPGVEIRIANVMPSPFSTIDPGTEIHLEIDVDFLDGHLPKGTVVVLSLHFDTSNDGKSVSTYTDERFFQRPRLTGSKTGIKLS